MGSPFFPMTIFIQSCNNRLIRRQVQCNSMKNNTEVLVSIESVKIKDFIFNTNKLRVIRGASYLLDYLAIDTWVEFLISATLAFPFIVLICWVSLLDKDIKKTLLHYVIERIPPKFKKIFIKGL